MNRLISILLFLSTVVIASPVLAQEGSVDIASCLPETGSRVPVEKATVYAMVEEGETLYHYVVLHPKDTSQSLGIVLVEVTNNQCKGHLVDFNGTTLPFENFVPKSVAEKLTEQAAYNWKNR